MKTNKKGFTLIELIMVIVILGILAAVAVPKFFSMTGTAHTKHKEAVYGTFKSALQLYAANQLVSGNDRHFPSPLRPDLDDEGILMDEIPEGWTYVPGAILTGGTWTYDGETTGNTMVYDVAADSSTYTLVKSW